MAAHRFRSRLISGLGLIVASLVSGLVPTACSQSATLPQLFPALTGLSDTPAVRIEVGWMGLSPLSPVSAAYRLELRNDQFEGVGQFKVATASASRAVTVPRDAVRAFLTAAGNAELVEKDYVPYSDHTDDYPSLSVIVDTAQGPLEIETRSQPHGPAAGKYPDRTPWAIDYLHRTFVVTAKDLDRAWEALEPRLHYGEVFDELAKQIRAPNTPPSR